MPYKTSLIKSYRLYEKFDFKDGNNELNLPILIEPSDDAKVKILEEITVVTDIDTEFIVPCIFDYLVSRHLIGLSDPFDAKALRLYFDFLESEPDLEWDVGSIYEHERPLKQYSMFLENLYHSGGIGGKTASDYFNAVVRFYKHHLKFNYPFKNGVPVEFDRIVRKKFGHDLLSHINGMEVVIDTATCKPDINSSDTIRRLVPFNDRRLRTYCKTLKNYASIEMSIICALAIGSGMRAEEIGDLRVDMIKDYSGEEDFLLILGPPSSHKTKKGSDMPVDVPGSLIQLLLDYLKTPRYLKRLAKSIDNRAHVFHTKSGKPYCQKTISTLFGQFNQKYIIPFDKSFDHKFQDLRATFGVITMKSAIDSGWSRSKCVAYTKKQMRHRRTDETLRYLEYWQSTEARIKQSVLIEEVLEEIYSMLGDA